MKFSQACFYCISIHAWVLVPAHTTKVRAAAARGGQKASPPESTSERLSAKVHHILVGELRVDNEGEMRGEETWQHEGVIKEWTTWQALVFGLVIGGCAVLGPFLCYKLSDWHPGRKGTEEMLEETNIEAGANLMNTTAAPNWWTVAVDVAAAFGLKPGYPLRFTLTTVLYAASWVVSLYASRHGLVFGKVVHSESCAWRAQFFLLVSTFAFFCDWLSMAWMIHTLPNVWTLGLECVACAAAAKQSLAHQGMNFMYYFCQPGVLLGFWFQGAWYWRALAIAGSIPPFSLHLLANGLSYDFVAVYLEGKQEEFEVKLLAGTYDYLTAVREYNKINEERRKLQHALIAAFFFSVCTLFACAVCLYDFFLMPWSAWPLLAWVLITAWFLSFVVPEPWIIMNEWPERLAERVAESIDGEFEWQPCDRTNFITLLSATRTSMTFLSFEITKSLRVAIPSLLFGWILYIAEINEVHHFHGFAFDTFCQEHG
mmetsp:Transcript_74064/g.140927  ORF Transcript_74064/g.140927 Transcript_74064/m.140927 type:complete len:485 (+) Transcript_74064:37-1491(+)